jgi:hypothetical protein
MNMRDFKSIRKAFSDLADTLAGDFDILIFLDMLCGYCADLLADCACGVLLADDSGTPALATASAEQARALMAAELSDGAGPATESLAGGTVVSCPGLAAEAGRWPDLVSASLICGYQAVDAVPMRLREQTIGALTLYRKASGSLDPDAAELAQAMAEVATIGIVHHRAMHQKDLLAQQLQTALDSRIIIEQAKGVLAERLQVPIDEAFFTLRRYARNNNLKLTEASRAVADGTLDIEPGLTAPCGHGPDLHGGSAHALTCRGMTELSLPFDRSRPNVARVYDYWLGGKDNYEADRVLARTMLRVFPGLRDLVRDNREFITRAVSWVAGQEIDQFIDLGAGLPTSPSIHESVQAVNPEASVVYLDNDPIVVNHVRALLAEGNPDVRVAAADFLEPDVVLSNIELRSVVDLERPACLVLGAILHLMDVRSARRIMAEYVQNLAAGSYVIISVAHYANPLLARRIEREYTAGTFASHTLAEVLTFFDGLEPLPPGLTGAKTWRSDGVPASGLPQSDAYVLGGVARKPGA